MLTAPAIRSVIASGEGYNAEFKVRIPVKVKELAVEICAFANAAGGILLLGVDDRNQLHGLTLDNARRSAIQHSLQEINPHIACAFYSVEVGDKEVWVIEVPSGSQKPYALSGAIYVRQGPNTQKITSVEQMRDFFQQSDRIYFDEGNTAGFDPVQDIDQPIFQEFRHTAHLSADVSQDQVVSNLKLLSSDGYFKNGAVLFFGKHPEQFFEKAVVRCVAFEGLTKYQIIDDKVFGGPLVRQYQQAMTWLKSKLSVRYKIEGGGPREEIWEIPELVSAVPLPEFGIKSHSRNPLVFGLFERMHLVEQIGSGIGRIRNEMARRELPAPEFRTEGMFTVAFQRVGRSSEESSEKLVDRLVDRLVDKQIEILKMIELNRSVSKSEMADKLNISTTSVDYHIKKLREKRILFRQGGGKGGWWEINDFSA